MYDLIIKNAKIIDGTGADEFKGAVGVIDGKLKFVNGDEEASQVIDAEGLYLTPGFIDAHSHGDQVLGQYPGMLAKINQGITTEIAGQCGGSMFPVTDEHIDLEKGLLAIGTLTFPDEMSEWKTAKEYFEYARKTPKIGNYGICGQKAHGGRNGRDEKTGKNCYGMRSSRTQLRSYICARLLR